MLPAEAPPRAPVDRRARGPLSAAASLGVAAITGAAVFAAGVYVAERPWPGARPSEAPPQASIAPPTAEVAATRSSAPTATATLPATAPAAAAVTATPPATATAATATAATSAAAAATPPATATEPPVRPARPGYGSLKVLSAAEATVYVNGVAAGPTNHPLEVRCGQFFLRLGAPTPQGTAWLGPGKTVVIECEAAGEIAF